MKFCKGNVFGTINSAKAIKMKRYKLIFLKYIENGKDINIVDLKKYFKSLPNYVLFYI